MILEQIVSATRERIAAKRSQKPLAELKHRIEDFETPKDLQRALQGAGIKLIAEIKRASPSKGWLRSKLDIATLARCYAQGGAAAISVLTEPDFFKGSLADLAQARQAVGLPLLCKDFILDPYQIYEARAHGADAILLIASILSLSELTESKEIAQELGMSALVEVHNDEEVEKALAAKASLIGINNRNLVDFSVNLETTLRLRSLLSPDITVVSESGIKSHTEVLALQSAGVKAVLIGETLVTSSNPEAKIKELMGELGW